jgi:hypothetical protein
MKNLIYFLLVTWTLSSCASTVTTTTASTTTTTASVQEVLSPAGNWDYTITGTPQGDFAGVLTITETGQLFSAILAVNGNGLPIENFAYNKETKKLTGEINYSGLVIAFEALMTGDELNGGLSDGEMQFPFKATRKK